MRKRLTLRTLTLTDIDGQFSGLDGIELGPVLACKSDTFDLCSRLCCPWPWPTWESCTDLEQRERPRMKPRTLAPITTLPLWALETTSSKLGRRTMYKASCQLIKQSFITREAFFFHHQLSWISQITTIVFMKLSWSKDCSPHEGLPVRRERRICRLSGQRILCTNLDLFRDRTDLFSSIYLPQLWPLVQHSCRDCLCHRELGIQTCVNHTWW